MLSDKKRAARLDKMVEKCAVLQGLIQIDVAGLNRLVDKIESGFELVYDGLIVTHNSY